ncbi:MAG: putative porin, partial [Gammaproteobacteria bacterium]|nr:putative porin [Gammaproteobacteria bacterium]
MKAIVAATGLAVVLAAPTVFAGGHGTEVDLTDLEWAKKISLKGDLRMRFQNDDDESRDGERDRLRLRARIEATAKPSDILTIGVGLASGSEDPVSTNQTIGEFNSSKSINLDKAYFNIKTGDNTNVGGGKFSNTIYRPGKSQLQWDGDWRPEGLYGTYDGDLFFGNWLVSWLDGEDDDRSASSPDDDLTLAIIQLGVKTEVAGTKVKAGIGYTQIDTEGQTCFDSGDCGQNSHTIMMGVHDTDFAVLDIFAEAGFTVGEQPLKAWAQYINNGDAEAAPSGDKLDSGYQVGAQLGKAKKKGTWQAKIYYQDLDADATLAALANSDFAGGGTDNEG